MLRDHRASAAATLRSLDPPTWHLRHSRAVAEIAGWLAARAVALGLDVDRARVESAALLHDVDKLLPPSAAGRDLPHGEGSAAWLERHGLEELGPLAAAHPVTRLADDGWAEAWLVDGPLGEWLVSYADKRAGQRLQPIAARFASWHRRYPDGWDAATAALVRRRAERLEHQVCARLRIAPDDVRRLAWTGAALREAALREAALRDAAGREAARRAAERPGAGSEPPGSSGAAA